MNKKLCKYLILVVIGLMLFVPTSVYAENASEKSVVLEYFNGSNTAISYAIDAEKSIDKVSVDATLVDSLKYVISNNSLSFTCEYLDSLSTGNHDVVITYTDESSTSISIEVKENVDSSLEENNVEDSVATDEINDILPDYYFVSANENEASSDTVKNDIYNSVVDTLTDNEINNSYDVSVEVGYPDDIFTVEVSVVNTTDTEDIVTKNGTIVYANADNYVESDHNLVNEFVNNNEFVYKNSYELVDDFSKDNYSLEEVQDYVADMFSESTIEYDFNEITDSKDASLVGKVLMFVNSKYYASANFYYKNVPYVYVPFFTEDINSYVASKAYDILVNKYNLSGHTISYRNGHLIDDTTGYDYGEFDYIIDDSYEFSYVSGDTVYEKLSNTNIEIKFDEDLGDAVSLTIGEVNVDNSSYNINGDTLVIDYDYLNTLKNNNYDLTLNTNRGVANTQITIIPKQYKYIDGENSTVDKGVKKTLTVRINADVNKFVNVYLNNNVLSSDVYTLREGSTIIDISFDYLKELNNGVYKLKTIFTDGEAVTNLSISGTKKEYKINSVSNQTYEKKSNNNVSFALNNVSNIVNLDINGVSISNSNYYVSGNNVVVKGSYLNNLNNGKYNVTIIFNDGSVNSYVNVKEKSSQSSSTSTGGSYYVPAKPYYRPTYVYTYDEYDDTNDDVVEEVKTEEVKTEESNILEVVPDSKKDKEIKNDTNKNTKKSTTKKSTSKNTKTKKTVEKKSKSKKSLSNIFKKKNSNKTTKTTKTTEKKSKSKKSLSSIFKKKDNTKTTKTTESTEKKNKTKKSLSSIFKKKESTKSSNSEKKVNDKKTDSSKKSIFSIFKKDDSTKKTTDKKVNEKEKNSSKKNTLKKNKTTSKKNLSSNKQNNNSESKPLLLTIDKIVNSRIFIATLIVLICGLSCYILYMVTKKDEED